MSLNSHNDVGHEARRLAALQRYSILDTPGEEAFDRLCALARDLLDAPLAAVALIDADREWTKARIGVEIHEWPRAWAFYPHVPGGPVAGQVYELPDAAADPRFAHNPLVTDAPHLRFYAASPLVSPDGLHLGMMAVGSPKPRPQGLSDHDRRHLVSLAALAVDELELRLQRRLAREASARAAAEAASAEIARSAEARLRKAHEAARAAAFDIAPSGEVLGATPRLRELLGLLPEAPLDRRSVVAALRPEFRAAFEEEADRVARDGGSFLSEVGVGSTTGTGARLVRWLQFRGAAEPPAAPGAGHGRILGVVLDVTARRVAEEALRRSERRLRLAQEAADVGAWEWLPDTGEMDWTPELRGLLALDAPPSSAGPEASLEAFLVAAHPEDRQRLWAAMQSAAAAPGADLDEEFRVVLPRRSGAGDSVGVRWLLGRGRRVPGGPESGPDRLCGVCVDVTGRREAAERERLLAREVDHRAKNALAVVLAALRLTRADDVKEYARLAEGRVAALAHAQTLLAERRWTGAELRAVAEGAITPVLRAMAAGGVMGGGSGPVEMDGPQVAIAAHAAQPIALALHEIGTNAARHGALTSPSGSASLSWNLDLTAARLRVRWVERGGPALSGPPSRRGFGLRLLEGTVRDQLGGAVSLSWEAEGFACTIEVPLARVLGVAADARDGGERAGCA